MSWDAVIDVLSSDNDSKSKVEALTTALESGGSGMDGRVSDLCTYLGPCFGDNNVKLCSLATAVVELLCSVSREGSLRGELDTLVAPMTEVLGNAKVSALFFFCSAPVAPAPAAADAASADLHKVGYSLLFSFLSSDLHTGPSYFCFC